jgi:hypothetical protein
MESLLPGLLERLLEPDVRLPAGSPLRVTHRRLDGHEVYCIINDSPTPYRGRVGLAAVGPGEAWDPETGAATALPGPEVDLALAGYTGTILRWAQARDRQLLAVPAPALGAQADTDLQATAVTASAGEHVAAAAVEATTLAGGRPGWRAVGQVRQSDVDTFLFLRLPFTAAVDGSAADFLVVDMEVPAGQTVAAQAFMFVVEADGGEFLAPLGFALNEAGAHRVWVPWARLQPVAWCKAGDGVLDRTKLAEVRLGWGGYHGHEGERLEFTLAAPRLGRLAP